MHHCEPSPIDWDTILASAIIGAFKADILAQDDTGRTVLIENQFGSTDHAHLGKIVTYAAHGVEVVVWTAAGHGPDIGRAIRREHCQTLEFLNEALVGRAALCAIGVHLESDPGQDDVKPRFRLAVHPDEYPPPRSSAAARPSPEPLAAEHSRK